MRRFTPEEDQFIRDNYLTMPAKLISKALGRADVCARQRMKLLGIVVPAEVVKKFAEDSRFKPGQEPPNKGIKQAQWLSKKGVKASSKTRFKKGNLPHNTRKDNDRSIRTDKRTGRSYIYIRVAKAKWVPLHRYRWEKKHGKIKKGMKLIFKDGNTKNCRLSNLKLLSDAELMQKNTYHNYPKPIANLIQLRGALTRKIRKARKRVNDEK